MSTLPALTLLCYTSINSFLSVVWSVIWYWTWEMELMSLQQIPLVLLVVLIGSFALNVSRDIHQPTTASIQVYFLGERCLDLNFLTFDTQICTFWWFIGVVCLTLGAKRYSPQYFYWGVDPSPPWLVPVSTKHADRSFLCSGFLQCPGLFF